MEAVPAGPVAHPASLKESTGPEGPDAAAAALLAASTQAANYLGNVEVDAGMNPAEVLSEPAARQAAARWRSGSAARRITAALARLTTSLQSWGLGATSSAARGSPELVPVRARPLLSGPSERPRWPTLEGILQNLWALRWRTWLACFLLLLFPRASALVVVLLCRYLIKGLVALIVYFGQELFAQIAVTVHEVEDTMVSWLGSYLHPVPHAPVSQVPLMRQQPSDGTAERPPAMPPQPGNHNNYDHHPPTRPIDVLTVLLLAGNLLRGQPGVGGGNPAG